MLKTNLQILGGRGASSGGGRGKMPALEGTAKQVEWAEDIRRDVINAQDLENRVYKAYLELNQERDTRLKFSERRKILEKHGIPSGIQPSERSLDSLWKKMYGAGYYKAIDQVAAELEAKPNYNRKKDYAPAMHKAVNSKVKKRLTNSSAKYWIDTRKP